ncbi:MAG TPA: CAAX prenyl protease-related protein [Usitatibacter sp.]|nr:CAAX prenyl protease-related protein [Usitatibacter sp.]
MLGPHVDERWLVVARGLVVGALLLLLWPRYTELLRRSRVGGNPAEAPERMAWIPASAGMTILSIAVGVAVFFAWVNLDQSWNSFEMGKGFVPLRGDGALDIPLVALRILGIALVVPVMEELFWRSLVMRWIDHRDFLAVDPRRASLIAFALSSALFALEHSQWLAGLLAGAAYAWLYMRSGNIWIPIISHATTNGILATWIVATGSWRFW